MLPPTRWMGLNLAALALTLMSLILAAPAHAESATEQGWWTSNSSVLGALGQVDVPAQGLLIDGGPKSTSGASDGTPAAYGALVYSVPVGARTITLSFTVATTSASTPASTLELCPLTKATIKVEQGGPISDAPSFDCHSNVTDEPPVGSTTYLFDAATLVSKGRLAVAILPTSGLERVVLAEPGASSLDLLSLGPSSTDPPSVVLNPQGHATTTTVAVEGNSAPSDPTSGLGGTDALPVQLSIGSGADSASSASPVTTQQSPIAVNLGPAIAGLRSSATTLASAGAITRATGPQALGALSGSSGSSHSNPILVLLSLAALILIGVAWAFAGRRPVSSPGYDLGPAGVEPD